MPPLLVTAALPYANGPLHLGHLAGAYLPADLHVRYQRMAGRDVAFVCGSDEHGAAIYIQALREGVTPQEVVDRYHAQIEAAFGRLGVSFDVYGRTTSARHRETSQGLFRQIDAAGGFVRKAQTQLFDPEAGLFLADRFVRGTCPVCGFDGAYGDQCENCGTSLSPEQLIDPTSTLSGATPEPRETTHWFLPLGQMQPEIAAWLDTKTDWKPNVAGQLRSWLADGLGDRAMTRDLPWGVPVPADGADGKVLYVWFDAPIGYLSITQEWAERTGRDWRHYWQVHEDGTVPELVHCIGKDNIVFHGIIFPAILMAANRAAGDDRPFVLPANVPANEFLNLEGRKLSTSRGWAVWVDEALNAFPADLLRYALATGLPETKDADFSWADFQTRANSELADVLGNFVNRALTFAERFTDNRVPELVDASPADAAALASLASSTARIGEAYASFRLREAVAETMALARLGNVYLQEQAPWATRTSNPPAMRNTVHVALQIAASLSVLLEPVTPDAAARLRAMLRLDGVRPSTPHDPAEAYAIGWADAGRPLLAAGHLLGAPAILFRKVEDEEIDAQRALLDARSSASAPPEADVAQEDKSDAITEYRPFAPVAAFDQFAALDLRAARITSAEDHPKADKLLVLTLDLGVETRQILSGVRPHLSAADVVGKTVVVVANFAPRTLREMESQGMVLTAEDRDGRLSFVETTAEPGAVVR